MGKKKKNVKVFDSTSNVEIIGSNELRDKLGSDTDDIKIKPDKNSGRTPDR